MREMKPASMTGSAMMSRVTRWLIALSAAMLAVVFLVPVWRISLMAPQYPEGLGMLIRINTITGMKPADLNNINGLNHYIGMKAIVPDAIPVLHVMPMVLAALVVLGLIAALFGRRWAGWTWLGLFAAAGVAGMVEFWRWSYDYGHNLAPDAIIKVPGMTYQPPLLGSKQLLNFTAISWPDIGGWIAAAAFLIGFVALVWPIFQSRRSSRSLLSNEAVAAAMILFVPGRLLTTHALPSADTVIVSPSGPVKTVSQGLLLVKSGGTLIVKAGRYAEPVIEVRKPVEMIGEGMPVLDGERSRAIMVISADNVTLKGFTFTRVGHADMQDPAAIRVENARNCSITGNRIEEGFFGIYLAKVTGCLIERNVLTATGRTEATSGNGIHLWTSTGITIANNLVSGYRDGIYFEFVHGTEVRGNISEKNLRYGLHFMYSDDCRYVGNTFRHNGSGVAVMYTRRVEMIGNRFENNWGSAAYGLLLKEIEDSKVEHNVFTENTTALLADGADRLKASHNVFERNGWAIKVAGSTDAARFESNDFIGNTFDVSTNSSSPSSTFSGNYWDAYRGYDLNRDGVGDVPHPPVRLFAVIVARAPQAIIMLRSELVSVLDAVERAMPSLTPELFVDPRPAMRRTA
ncbi:MAG TPA: nitrous oxide reductase family maturation protein NosD [Gemmatimonadaceae bacterium]|nr:nitrous oxide reductase family maturation protein NosD [Gemmatimonadaceae bacterium]